MEVNSGKVTPAALSKKVRNIAAALHKITRRQRCLRALSLTLEVLE